MLPIHLASRRPALADPLPELKLRGIVSRVSLQCCMQASILNGTTRPAQAQFESELRRARAEMSIAKDSSIGAD